MQINWTMVAGLAAFSLAAAASWDAGTVARRRGPWRGLAVVYLVLLVEVVLGCRFAAIGAIPGIGRHAAQIGMALFLLLAAAIGVAVTLRAARGVAWFAPAAWVALGAVMLFGAEALSLNRIGALLYRPAGPVMLIAWAWLACGVVAVGIAVLATLRSSPARGGGRPQA